MISVDEPAKPRSKYVSTLKTITPGTDGANNTEDEFLSCAELGDYARLEKCIDNHVYINCKDSESGLTALHAASGWGHLECAQWLLSKGANVLAADKERQTALHSAAKGNHVSLVHLLLDRKVT
jgi:ankyrin repeat protein